MKNTTQISHMGRNERAVNLSSGLPVRTNLRAGLAWDDLDDQAKSLWNSLTGAVSSAVNSITGGDTATTAS